MGVGSTVIAVLATGIAATTAFFALANRATRRIHAAFGTRDVESALQSVLDDSQCHDDFDLFLAWPIDDPYLESIRKRCQEIIQTSAPAKPGEDIGDDGKERIREIVRDLQGRR